VDFIIGALSTLKLLVRGSVCTMLVYGVYGVMYAEYQYALHTLKDDIPLFSSEVLGKINQISMMAVGSQIFNMTVCIMH